MKVDLIHHVWPIQYNIDPDIREKVKDIHSSLQVNPDLPKSQVMLKFQDLISSEQNKYKDAVIKSDFAKIKHIDDQIRYIKNEQDNLFSKHARLNESE